MKLAAVYNAWDCEYMLDSSIAQIYDHVDRVIIVWQTVSNYGQVNDNISTTIQVLAVKYPKLKHIYYVPNLAQTGTYNEKQKRLIGLTEAQKDCTHFLFMDCDEYYVPSEFTAAKQEFIDRRLDTSYVKLITYFKQPNYRLEPLEGYYVPFICTTKIKQIGGFPKYVDPTRGVTPAGNCGELSIKMHHMSYVRKDMRAKIENSSARVNVKDIDKRLQEIDNWQLGQPHPFMAGFDIVECDPLFEVPM